MDPFLVRVPSGALPKRQELIVVGTLRQLVGAWPFRTCHPTKNPKAHGLRGLPTLGVARNLTLLFLFTCDQHDLLVPSKRLTLENNCFSNASSTTTQIISIAYNIISMSQYHMQSHHVVYNIKAIQLILYTTNITYIYAFLNYFVLQ